MPFSSLSSRSSGYKVLASDWNGVITDVNFLGEADRCVMVTDTATTSVNNVTWQQMTFASEEYDTGGFHSTSSNTSRLTIPTGYGGIYRVTASVTWTAYAGNGLFLQVRKNGAASTAASLAASIGNFGSLTANMDPIVTLNGQLRLAAGDYIELYTAQNSGSALALKGTTQAHRFGITWDAA
ncbi:MAG: hypothetical protein RL219_186 [Actinomycetota bacterium]|jgi:hypothetical protein